MLVDELRAIGLEDAQLDEHGYVIATLPATVDRDMPTIGLDRPRRHRPRRPERRGEAAGDPLRGRQHTLPGDPARCCDPEEMPELADHVGHELVTSDGTTLLGADDKGGVAEIMAAVAYLVRAPGDRARARRGSRSRPTRRSARARTASTSRASAPTSPTRSTARRPARSRTRPSPRWLTVTFMGRGTSIPAPRRAKLVNAVKLAAHFVATPAAGRPLAGDDRGARGLRPPGRSIAGTTGAAASR